MVSLQLISGCSFFISHTFHSSVYYERKDVPGITIELLGATILFHLSKKKKNKQLIIMTLCNLYQALISMYHLGINPRLLMHLQSLEYSLMPESQLVRRAFWQLKLLF